MGDQLRFVDDSGDTRLAGQLVDDGATVGDVLTVQSDGSLAAASGGSIPDPVTTTINAEPATGKALNIVAADNAADFIDVLTIHSKEGEQLVEIDSGGDFYVYLPIDGSQFRVQGISSVIKVNRNADTSDQLGFFNASPVDRPTVNNATAADIIAALASLGLIIDGT